MANMLLMLSSFYKETDLENHPRICVFFNNVSKFDARDSQQTRVSWKDFIIEYREILLEVVKASYKNVFDEAYLKERIEKLLPDCNFYFYKMKESEIE